MTEVIKMSIRYGFNYHTDENISNLAMMIAQKADGSLAIMKHGEKFEDIFATYVI